MRSGFPALLFHGGLKPRSPWELGAYDGSDTYLIVHFEFKIYIYAITTKRNVTIRIIHYVCTAIIYSGEHVLAFIPRLPRTMKVVVHILLPYRFIFTFIPNAGL